MKTSCIIPFHNPGPYLVQAIESALGQSRPPDEVVLVDDGSTDGSAAIAAAFGDRVSLAKQPHRGIAAARNLGLRQAAGPVIAFLDADDVWPADRMTVLLAALDEHPDADIVLGRIALIADRPPTREERKKFENAHLRMALSSMLVRRALFDRIGRFNENLAVAEDTEFMMRAHQAGAMVHTVEATTLNYRLHEGNVSRHVARVQSATVDALRSVLASRRRA